jgi:CheY-like chemotaxis protein
MATRQLPTAMCGVLVDVSRSMRDAYSLDRSQRVNVERTHAILTTVMNIVRKEVVHHQRQDSIFVSAFGLKGLRTLPDKLKAHRAATYETIDLLCLLDFADPKIDGYRALIDLAAQHGAHDVQPWIERHLSQQEAKILYIALHSNKSLIRDLLDAIERSTSPKRVVEETAMLAVKEPTLAVKEAINR